MTSSDFQLRSVSDPRLAVHATSPLPAWLWSLDGARVLWANPVGARLFGAANSAELAARKIGPADPQRRQVARLAHQLPVNGAVRMERLRGFGASLGVLMTCACLRLKFADGSQGVLVTAMDTPVRVMPLNERLQRLVEGAVTPMAAFATDGAFIAASELARPLRGCRNLEEAGLEHARSDALATGRVEMPIGNGHVVLQRVGSGADTGLIAMVQPAAPQTPPEAETVAAEPATAAAPEPPVQAVPDTPAVPAVPDYEQPALSNEAPSEFMLFDPFNEPLDAPAPAPTSEPVVPAPGPAVEAVSAPVEAAPVQTPVEDSAKDIVPPQVEPITGLMDEPPPHAEKAAPRNHPLRFLWQMDAEGRFVLGSDEFIRLMGAHSAAGFGRPWSEIADVFGLDPEGRVAKAIASRDTWAGVTVKWPVDGGEPLTVELAGLPVYDRARNFAGFKGFGVCRDLDGLNKLEALRRFELFTEPPVAHRHADIAEPIEPRGETVEPTATAAPTDIVEDDGVREPPPSRVEFYEPEIVADMSEQTIDDKLPEQAIQETTQETSQEPSQETSQETIQETIQGNSQQTDLDQAVETPPNVVPFRPLGETTKAPTLTPVENSAFNELARQLSERLEREQDILLAPTAPEQMAQAVSEPPPPPPLSPEPPQAPPPTHSAAPTPSAAEWLTEPKPAPRGDSARDRVLLDLLPSGILIYRLDRLLYANPAFLARMGFASLHALEDAGGLDALYVAPGVSSASSTSEAGTPVTVSANHDTNNDTDDAPADGATEAHLHTISWDGESAHALICGLPQAATVITEAVVTTVEEVEAIAEVEPDAEAGQANAEDLAAILDTTAEGIIMFDAEGNIHACNRSAEALFGYDGEHLLQQNLATLFAPESQRVVADYLDSLKSHDIASLLDYGREVLGREAKGGLIPLAMIMGRTRPDGPNFFAVFRDLSQSKKGEKEMREAQALSDRAANAKADMLARISHEIRTPLNAIIGFSEVMISERFGALGNERYGEYMKDIRASGERVISIIDDLEELTRIETGKLDLAFTNLNLNDLVEACVVVMQPQANRERIIIRTSLAHALPSVTADARAMRQIAMNLIGNSIRLASAGGQVIVSTALTDRGEVVLRIRDTGHGLSEREVAAAMEPFRTPPPSDAADNSALNLSLTKALVEANRAKFHIKSAANSGTLIEVVFSQALARA
ncbi:PAS domain-containing sensor histidine kinase [Bradyrhizobium guangdongense]|uniref:sensor histidine kinase n=1 Tax=Bradyrhizobium guangdongense TaxID=1325090 RepID=UPI00112A17DB|nr:PAS domain-containing sensor histidine kinase [Bradyrhizobium guangdongense]TPQ39530.1 PAS domain-containing sensor histidine kinase [Bradyrhizobium guangdongense]